MSFGGTERHPAAAADATATDEELCRIVREGSAWPLEALWQRHSAAAQSWARKKDADAAEDIVAGSFARVFQALLAGGGPSTSFRGYLYRTMDSLLVAHWAAQRRTSPLDGIDLEASSGEAPADPLGDAEERAAATAALSELPERWREIIVAVDVEGRPVQEVARELELSPNSASALLLRARGGLRKGWLQRLHRPGRGLAGACRSTVDQFAALRWGKKGTRRRVEAELHLTGCEACRRRYAGFTEQAATVGLSLSSLIALSRDWRERLVPTLATSAAVVASFSVTVSVAPIPVGPPPEPETVETVETVAPEEPSGQGGAPAPPRGEDGAVVGENAGPTGAAGPEAGEDATETLYFGDWSGWNEERGGFTRAP